MVGLLSSGETGLIRDKSLRRALIKLDLDIQTAARSSDKITDLVWKNLEPLQNHVVETWRLSPEGDTITGIQTLNYDLAAMRADPRLLPAMSTLMGMNSAEIRYRGSVAEGADKLHKQLEALE